MKALFVFWVAIWIGPDLLYAETDFFTKTDSFLHAYAKDGRVDYETIKKDHAKLDTLLLLIKTYDPKTTADPLREKAFWINAYNLLVIKNVVDLYPIKSPRDEAGFFNRIKHLAAKDSLTLDQLEQIKLRERYKDARLHFALVCAAVGCPPLGNKAYLPENVDKQLETRTANAINNPAFVRVDTPAKKVYMSEIFSWYQADFERPNQTLLQFINRYRSNDPIPANYAIEFMPYNWNLNKSGAVE